MSNKLKTITDIIAEKRRIAKSIRDKASNGDYWDKKIANEEAEEYEWDADDIEAAYKRELGNAQKLREVVELLARVILPPQEEYSAEYGGGKVPDNDGWLAWIRQMQVRACDALAAPSRNCDVGTAEEQTERFRKFCKMDYISEDCPDDCPLYKDHSTIHCPFAWAQMPYEKEESK